MKINEVTNSSLSQEFLLNESPWDNFKQGVIDKFSDVLNKLPGVSANKDTKALDKMVKHNERFTSTRDSLVGHLLWRYSQAYPEIKEKDLKNNFTIKFPSFKKIIRDKIGSIYDAGDLDLALIYVFEHDKISNRASLESDWDNIKDSKMSQNMKYPETYEVLTKLLMFLSRLQNSGGEILTPSEFNITNDGEFIKKMRNFGLIASDDDKSTILNIDRITRAHGNVAANLAQDKDKNKNLTKDPSFDQEPKSKPGAKPCTPRGWDQYGDSEEDDILKGRTRQADVDKGSPTAPPGS